MNPHDDPDRLLEYRANRCAQCCQRRAAGAVQTLLARAAFLGANPGLTEVGERESSVRCGVKLALPRHPIRCRHYPNQAGCTGAAWLDDDLFDHHLLMRETALADPRAGGKRFVMLLARWTLDTSRPAWAEYLAAAESRLGVVNADPRLVEKGQRLALAWRGDGAWWYTPICPIVAVYPEGVALNLDYELPECPPPPWAEDQEAQHGKEAAEERHPEPAPGATYSADAPAAGGGNGGD